MIRLNRSTTLPIYYNSHTLCFLVSRMRCCWRRASGKTGSISSLSCISHEQLVQPDQWKSSRMWGISKENWSFWSLELIWETFRFSSSTQDGKPWREVAGTLWNHQIISTVLPPASHIISEILNFIRWV